jgi:hypothetical protein
VTVGGASPAGRHRPGSSADIVTILLPPGMSWHAIEATLLAAAPSSARADDGCRPFPATASGEL